ncbi:MAG: UDP-glucose dehydrogenase family protein [Bacilli bacterium]
MKVAVAGTGYVGLVTGVVLAEIGHKVVCVDIDKDKIKKMQRGISPIFEKDLEKLMLKNKERLTYTTHYKSAYKDAEVIIIGVGTPEKKDGSANLDYVFNVCGQIAESAEQDIVVVIKSTVPIGTNGKLEKILNDKKIFDIKIDVVSNPEFLAQGTAVRDTFYASRIVVGAENEKANEVMKRLYEPLMKEPYNIPYLYMNRESAEMVKYASNNFLALKISYVNEIANLCEKVGANIEDVTKGMGYDNRIGNKFLRAGIGYGGSCFPKDTKALYYLAKEFNYELNIVKATIKVNELQKIKLFEMAKEDFGDNLRKKNVAILGLSFKPETDDLREAASIDMVKLLLDLDVKIGVYDPIAMDNFRKIYGKKVEYYNTIETAIRNKDIVFILTEWSDIVNFDLNKYEKLMKTPIIYDGRNCYSLERIKNTKIKYRSIGRESV